MSDQTMKLNNRQTWRDQINVKRQQVAAEMVEGTSLFQRSERVPSCPASPELPRSLLEKRRRHAIAAW